MKGKNGKPVKVKAGMYALFYMQMKGIAEDYGYNLLLNGSMERDMDLIAVPWINNPTGEQEMIKEFQKYLTGIITTSPDGTVPFTILPGIRHAYIIELNRGDRHGDWTRFEDEEFYLDISVVKSQAKTVDLEEELIKFTNYLNNECGGSVEKWILEDYLKQRR